jgi:hypothetical protein
MDEGWPYKKIREWLFQQTAESELPALELKAGDSYSLVWARTTKSAEHAGDACEQALSNWYGTRYPDWVKQKEAGKDESARPVQRVEGAGSASGEKGLSGGENLLIRSLVMDAMTMVHQKDKNPRDIARLAQAWARMSDAGVQTEKLNLRTKELVDMGLDALWDEFKQHPVLREAFERFRDVVKQYQTGGGQPTAGGS